MKTEINLPVRIEVEDYHEFSYLEGVLRKIIPGIKVVEVGFIDRLYNGVAYVGDKRAPETMKLFSDIEREAKEWDAERR